MGWEQTKYGNDRTQNWNGMNWLKHWLTESDNQTFDPSKAMGIYAFLHYHAISGWQVLHQGATFDPVAYGTGIGALFTTLGVLFGLKKESK